MMEVTLSDYRCARSQSFLSLVDLFVKQLTVGCKEASFCICKARTSRRYTPLSARAIAVVLATKKRPEEWLCPRIRYEEGITNPVERQEKLDPKSIMQQLFDSNPGRSLQRTAPTRRPCVKGIPDDSERNLGSQHTIQGGGTLEQSQGALQIGLTQPVAALPDQPNLLTCKTMRDMRTGLTMAPPASSRPSQSAVANAEQVLFHVLGNYGRLAASFGDTVLGLEVWDMALGTLTVQDLDSLSNLQNLNDAFSGWIHIDRSIIFNSLWQALEPLFDSPFALRARHSGVCSPPPSVVKSEGAPRVAMVCLEALVALLPDTTHDGADGGMPDVEAAYTPTDWIKLQDALEYGPAIRLCRRLIRAIGARTCLEETVRHVADSDETTQKSLPFLEDKKNIRKLIVSYMFLGNKTPRPLSMYHRWLFWLKRCFLEEWDGLPRINRWSVAGSALELMEDICKEADRDTDSALLSYNVFHIDRLQNHFDINAVAEDWLEFEPDKNTRHVLSFTFLATPQGLTRYHRAINHVHMTKAYSDAERATMSRHRSMLALRPTNADIAYLDRRMKVAEEHYLVLRINRHSVLSDALDQLWQRERRELLRPLRVRMGMDEGEMGHDLGGVQMEFFNLVCQEALNPEYSLFTTDSQTHLSWFQPVSMVPLYKYKLFGLLFGLAVYNGITLPVSFPIAFYRKLLGLTCHRKHFAEGWPALASGLKDMMNYQGDVENDLARDYVYSFDANGLHIDAEMGHTPPSTADMQPQHAHTATLKVVQAYPDKAHVQESQGKSNAHADEAKVEQSTAQTLNQLADAEALWGGLDWPGWEVQIADADYEPMPVTNENREAYYDDYIDWTVHRSIEPQFAAFGAGFFDAVDRKAIELLTPECFRLLVEGSKDLDVSVLELATNYDGYTRDSPVVRWFWELVHSFPAEKQKRVLEFVTASKRVPFTGAASLRFSIERAVGSTTALPGSSTCFGMLRLPEYESKEVLASKLDIALEFGFGFGQA